MSSTNRGGKRSEADYYPTPAWVVWRLLDWHGGDLGFDPMESLRILEPTVGDGAIVRAVREWYPGKDWFLTPEWTGIERRHGVLHPETRLDHHFEGVDFRSWKPPNHLDLAIGNPPFSMAESILRRAIPMASVTAMLLRLNFLGSEERVPFWKEFPRPAVRVIPERVSFNGVGTDSDYVAWFIWGTAVTGIDVLDLTPLEIRNAHKPKSPISRAQLAPP